MSINSKNFPNPNQVTPFCFGEGKGKKNFHSTKSVPHFFSTIKERVDWDCKHTTLSRIPKHSIHLFLHLLVIR